MSNIYFKESGSGKNVILLHGFPMHSAVWNNFASELAKDFRVLTPDLPGFGKSKSLTVPFTLSEVADSMLQWIAENQLTNSAVIGHSMGGYVALAMAEKNDKAMTGLCLFHSTAYADNAEKKDSRSKVIEFVNKNGVYAFSSNFIQPLFANPDHPAIPTVKEITVQASAEAVKSYTLAMRDRPDRTHVLQSFKKPVLFIGGTNDPAIPADSISAQGKLIPGAEVHILKNVAHMGMFERPVEILTIVRSFLLKI